MLRARVATCVLPVAVCMLLVGAAGRAQAAGNPNLERARQELDDLRYDDAQRSLEVALRSGDSGPEDLVEIYRLMGFVAAAKNDENAARRAFEILLSVAPQTRLPEGASPKITEPFDAARKSTEKKGPLRARYQVRADGKLLLIVENDPLGLVQGGVAIYDDEGLEQRVVRRGKPPFEIPVPQVAELEVRLAIIDANGNHLVEFGNAEEPLRLDVAGGGEGTPDEPGDDKTGGAPIYARWYVWGGVAVLSGAAGTYFGLDVLAAQDELEALNERSQGVPVPFSEALAIQERGERSALLANIGFGVAGAAAVAAVVLYVMKPGESRSEAASEPAPSEESEDSAFLVPTAGPGGFGVAVFGRF